MFILVYYTHSQQASFFMERKRFIKGGLVHAVGEKPLRLPIAATLMTAGALMAAQTDKNHTENAAADSINPSHVMQMNVEEFLGVPKFEIVTPVPMPTLVPTETPTLTPTPIVLPTLTPEPTATPIPVQNEVGSASAPDSAVSDIPEGKVRLNFTGQLWERFADCETGDGPNGVTNNEFWVEWGYKAEQGSGFDGAFQFDVPTWRGLESAAGYDYAWQAPPEVQIAAFYELYAQRGLDPWPACKQALSANGFVRILVNDSFIAEIKKAA